MKIVNPLGKTVNKNDELSADPRGCMCSSGANTTRQNAGSCFICGCQCSSGITNRDANHAVAKNKVAY